MKGLALLAAFLALPAFAADPPPRLTPAEWTIPMSVGYAKGLEFGLGAGYRFKDGLELSVQAVAQDRDAINGTATGTYDYDLNHRWPVVPVSLPYHVPGGAVYGARFTLTIPIRR